MAKHRSIPPGFMTVGEAAKKIGSDRTVKGRCVANADSQFQEVCRYYCESADEKQLLLSH